jgi:hypothetical protein
VSVEIGRFRYAEPVIQSLSSFILCQFGHILLGVPYHISA